MFNHYVKVALAEKEWSQATLARKMKKPKSWLNDRMGGRTEFREPEMAAIVKILDMSDEQIIKALRGVKSK